MRRIAIGLFCLFSLGVAALGEEVVTNSSGEEIVLYNTGRWITKERADKIKAFEDKVDIEILKMNKKSNQYRTMTFKVTNRSMEDLTYAAFGVKFRFGEEYSLRKLISVNNLKAGESVEIQRQISVQDIEGRDTKIEVIDYSF
ncbi:hypothetical protein PM10SUCC1_03770 [Propionigenium maris DSM 9537]|uniref:DUF4352 domain-containing protein n=1 Tax=Propionigenium maris DSM 9537 TaxID=1123000 RepID=A0A9W6GIT1_9FUSO|nr:hypothetical protein [Propionigenium maris]GLI54862.1 hypothetical protein PM10SUCC1_03770 [Propionigenium maris DSM 9537]